VKEKDEELPLEDRIRNLKEFFEEREVRLDMIFLGNIFMVIIEESNDE
jgi:hypothetical protein